MARKERNNIDYFPHPVTHGKKMFYLRSKHKNDGYAVWFMLLEELGKADYHYLDLSSNIQMMYLSSSFMVDEIVLRDIINILVEFDEFDKDLWYSNSILFNNKFIENIQDAYRKRNNECITKISLLRLLESKGILLPTKGSPNKGKGILKVSSNTQSKVEYSIEDKSKEEEIKLNFDLFWNLYPHKIAKTKCEPKWNKLKLEQQEKILATLPNFIKYKPFETYTHPNPETYLNQERWEDELSVVLTESREDKFLRQGKM